MNNDIYNAQSDCVRIALYFFCKRMLKNAYFVELLDKNAKNYNDDNLNIKKSIIPHFSCQFALLLFTVVG